VSSRVPTPSWTLGNFGASTLQESQSSLSAVPPLLLLPLFLRLPNALGSYVALFLTVDELVVVYVSNHSCRTFVANHIKTAAHLSFGHFFVPRSTVINEVDVTHESGGCLNTSNDYSDRDDNDNDGIGASRRLSLGDLVSGECVYAIHTPKTLVALGFRLVCAHARRLRTFDCRAIPSIAEPQCFEASGSLHDALAQLILGNRRTLQSVRALPPLLNVVALVALRECVHLSVFDSADCRDLVNAARGASHINDLREVEYHALANVLQAAKRIKHVCLAASDLDWGDNPDTAPISGVHRVRSLMQFLSSNTITHLTLRPATGTLWIDSNAWTCLIDLGFQLEQTLFVKFCATFGERLPTLASLTRLRISMLDGSSTSLAKDEVSKPIVWYSSSLCRLTLCGSAQPVASAAEMVAGDANNNTNNNNNDDDDDDDAMIVTTVDTEFGGNTSPARWPRVVAPHLVEFRGELDLEALTDLVADAPQLVTLVCLRARSRCLAGTDDDDLARHVHRLRFDHRDCRLMTVEAIKRFVDTVGRRDVFQHLTVLNLRGFPLDNVMLDAIGDTCRDRNLERVRLQVTSRADDHVPRFLHNLAASLRDCILTRARYADGSEIDGSSRDPVPLMSHHTATLSLLNLEAQHAIDTSRVFIPCGVVADGWRSDGGGDDKNKKQERGTDVKAMAEQLLLPRLVRLRLPGPCWSHQLITTLDAPMLDRLCFAAHPGVSIDSLFRRLARCRHLTIDLSAVESADDSPLPCVAWYDCINSAHDASFFDRSRDRGPQRPVALSLASLRTPSLASLRLEGVGTKSLVALASWLPTVTDLEIVFAETLTTSALELALVHLRLVTVVQFPRLLRLRFRNRLFSTRDATQRHRILTSLGAIAVANYRLRHLDLPENADADARAKMSDLLRPI
jgi:hypothetical protein